MIRYEERSKILEHCHHTILLPVYREPIGISI